MTALPMSQPVQRFVDIATSRKAKAAIELAMALVAPVAINGPSGTGKSSALIHFAPAYRATYCECSDFNKTPIGAFRMLMAAYGFRSDAKQYAEMAAILYERLNWRSFDHQGQPNPKAPEPLFVDEWQTLEPAAQREILRLAETCRLPLVLSGNGESLRSRRNRVALEQISTRITAVFETERLSHEDSVSICIDWNVEGAPERKLVWRLAQAMPFRELNRILVAARAHRGAAGSIVLANLSAAVTAFAKSPAEAQKLLRGDFREGGAGHTSN